MTQLHTVLAVTPSNIRRFLSYAPPVTFINEMELAALRVDKQVTDSNVNDSRWKSIFIETPQYLVEHPTPDKFSAEQHKTLSCFNKQ